MYIYEHPAFPYHITNLHTKLCSSTSIMIRHHFHSEVWQPEILPGVSIPSCSDLFSIKFQLFDVTRSSCRTEQEGENVTSDDLEESKLVAERQTKPLSRVQLLCLRTRDTWLIYTCTLPSTGVPRAAEPDIITEGDQYKKVKKYKVN